MLVIIETEVEKTNSYCMTFYFLLHEVVSDSKQTWQLTDKVFQ